MWRTGLRSFVSGCGQESVWCAQKLAPARKAAKLINGALIGASDGVYLVDARTTNGIRIARYKRFIVSHCGVVAPLADA